MIFPNSGFRISKSFALFCRVSLCLLLFTTVACQEKPSEEPVADASTSISSPEASSPAKDSAFTIDPGERIGQIRLGMSPEEVQTLLGKPDLGDAAMGKAKMIWLSAATDSPRHRVDVYTVREFTGEPEEVVRVRQVRITSPNFSLAGLRVSPGSRLTQIQPHFPNLEAVAYYPSAQQNRVYVYDDRVGGIAFELTGPDSVCVAITIHPKGRGVEQEYMPLDEGLVKLKP